MRVGSLFAGVGGFELAALRLGWRLVWAAETDAFALRVHRRRFAGAAHVGDARALRPNRHNRHKPEYRWARMVAAGEAAIDVLCAGWPCQDHSVAGLRAGLKGGRSGLFFEIVRVARLLRPAWLVLENVPGLFSSGERRDYLEVLAALDGIGYGLGWRVLDAQFFGVPQRRRRLFLVGRLGAECPAAVLFEPEGLRGDPAAGGEAGARTAVGAPARAVGGVSGGLDPGAGKGDVVAGAVAAKWAKGTGGPAGDEAQNLIVAPTVTEQMRHTGNDAPARHRIVVAPLTGRPEGLRADEAAGGQLVVASPIQANEQRAYTNEGNNFRARNLVIAPPAFEDAEGVDDDALRADGEDPQPADGPRAGADGGAAPDGDPVPRVGARPAGDAGRRAAAPAAGDPDQLVLLAPLPGALPGAEDERGVLGAEDGGQPPAGRADGPPAPRPGVHSLNLVDARADGAVSPTVRAGGREQGAGSSYDNTPVVIQDARVGVDSKRQNGSGISRAGVAYTLDGASAQAVAFEPRLARNGRGAPSDVVPPLLAENGTTGQNDRAPVVVGLAQITSRLNRTNPQPGDPATTLAKGERLAVFGFKPGYFTRGKDGGPADLMPPLSADADKGDQDPVVFAPLRGLGHGWQGQHSDDAALAGLPRRLTPVECERLQGFPDGWTCLCGAVERALEAAGVPPAAWLASDWRTLRIDGLTAACRCKDSARYRALGNAVAVPVVGWILGRLAAAAT